MPQKHEYMTKDVLDIMSYQGYAGQGASAGREPPPVAGREQHGNLHVWHDGIDVERTGGARDTHRSGFVPGM